MMIHIHALPKLLCLELVLAIGICERLDFSFRFQGETWFHEGINLELYCRQDTTNGIKIELLNTGTIVEESHLVDEMTDKYYFQKNSSVSVLVIKKLSRYDKGIYTCNEAEQTTKFLQIDVLYSPSDKSPQCTSNYESPVIFDDIRQDYINLTCISDEGNPPVSITLHIFQSRSTYNISDVRKMCTVHQKFGNSRSVYCHMNESLNNTTFLCNAAQQLPSPYIGGNNGSCSFGPLHFISNFSITINEVDVTLKEGDGINLTCTANVTRVGIKWIGIPADWDYRVTQKDYFSHIWIKSVTQQSKSEITVQCVGSYGYRNITDSVTLMILGKRVHQDIFLSSLIVTIFIFTFTIVVVSVVCFRWRQNRGEIDDNRAESNNFQSTYTTTVKASNESVENGLDVPNGTQEYDHSILRVGLPGNNPDTKYYDIPLQSTKNYLDDGGYMVPSLSHPRPPLYQHIA